MLVPVSVFIGLPFEVLLCLFMGLPFVILLWLLKALYFILLFLVRSFSPLSFKIVITEIISSLKLLISIIEPLFTLESTSLKFRFLAKISVFVVKSISIVKVTNPVFIMHKRLVIFPLPIWLRYGNLCLHSLYLQFAYFLILSWGGYLLDLPIRQGRVNTFQDCFPRPIPVIWPRVFKIFLDEIAWP